MPENFFSSSSGDDKPEANAPQIPIVETFAERARGFWAWFQANEESLFRALQDGSLDANELSLAVDRLNPRFAWELCPSEDEGREGFALSSAGDTTLRLLVQFAVTLAPPTKRWVFFTSKQPATGMVSTGIDGIEIEFSSYRFALRFGEDKERLEVSVHHPCFADLDESDSMQAAFIVLDSTLGENFVEAFIGPIDIATRVGEEHKHSWEVLRNQARAAVRLQDLDPDIDPGDRWYTYSRKDLGNPERIPRSDIVGGNTRHLELIQDLDEPDRKDPLAGSGASFAYLRFPSHTLSAGREVLERGEIEDALAAALQKSESARFLGGAHGQTYAYIDWILFDEERAVEVMKDVLAKIERVEGASLGYFAPTRARDRVVLKGER